MVSNVIKKIQLERILADPPDKEIFNLVMLEFADRIKDKKLYVYASVDGIGNDFLSVIKRMEFSRIRPDYTTYAVTPNSCVVILNKSVAKPKYDEHNKRLFKFLDRRKDLDIWHIEDWRYSKTK